MNWHAWHLSTWKSFPSVGIDWPLSHHILITLSSLLISVSQTSYQFLINITSSSHQPVIQLSSHCFLKRKTSPCFQFHMFSSPHVFIPTCFQLHMLSSPHVLISTCFHLHTCFRFHMFSSPHVFISTWHVEMKRAEIETCANENIRKSEHVDMKTCWAENKWKRKTMETRKQWKR